MAYPEWDGSSTYPPPEEEKQGGYFSAEDLSKISVSRDQRKMYDMLAMLGWGGNMGYGAQGYGNQGYGSNTYGGYGGMMPRQMTTAQKATGIGGSVVGLISDFSSMLSAGNEHRDYANEILDQNMEMPGGIHEAETELIKLSQGLPGYEVLKQRIMNTVPTLMSQFEQLGSTNQVLAELGKAGGRASYQLDSLGVQNEEAKLRNNLALINFLGNVKAPMQAKINEFDINKKLAADQERLLASKEDAQGVENVASDLISLVGLAGLMG
jgi:hypothetical protein